MLFASAQSVPGGRALPEGNTVPDATVREKGWYRDGAKSERCLYQGALGRLLHFLRHAGTRAELLDEAEALDPYRPRHVVSRTLTAVI